MTDPRHIEWIPNIILGQDYDQRYIDAPIHYDELENLADFFGRDMPVHRHAQYIQIHYIDRGPINFHIDDLIYQVTGPACFLTPASTPHSFLTSRDARGHVLTIHQSLLWQLMKDGLEQEIETDLSVGICIERGNLPKEQRSQWTRLAQTLRNIRAEWSQSLPAKNLAMDSLVRLLLVRIARLATPHSDSVAVNNDDLRLFHRFSDLIEEHFREQWQLPRYTEQIGVSESRLNQICHRISNRSPKKLIHDRLIQEAKRMLTFTSHTSNEICYALGFTDPAYFSRFFKKHTGMTAQQFRKQQE
ncbi:MAG: 4-hydroxyphenylacetate catabolism regulatory protein HpaA [Oceanospirillaceae bacterium]|uniref:4-hydroxyphenylacetate catabolism regulatory protein HpaA n=1 Tax=Marinobacterium litorale TaxID=404770 RepID=UPI0004229F58|nr:4-hydroxyphenylacetate catabolism regulatory protein HpaA [Marinobacterium litorale]MBT00528.1 4-hydroxyphenylacetate catabolism regulatory protein HpaA [Oceanospirillaceae bacterium]